MIWNIFNFWESSAPRQGFPQRAVECASHYSAESGNYIQCIRKLISSNLDFTSAWVIPYCPVRIGSILHYRSVALWQSSPTEGRPIGVLAGGNHRGGTDLHSSKILFLPLESSTLDRMARQYLVRDARTVTEWRQTRGETFQVFPLPELRVNLFKVK
jgi:hypothetical protein